MRHEALSLGLTVLGTLFYCLEVAGSGSRPRKKSAAVFEQTFSRFDSLRENINSKVLRGVCLFVFLIIVWVVGVFHVLGV